MRIYCLLDTTVTPLASVDMSQTCQGCEDDVRRSRDGRYVILRLAGESESLPAFTDGHMIFTDVSIRQYLRDNAAQW